MSTWHPNNEAPIDPQDADLDALLDEAAASEHARPLPDRETFLADLRAKTHFLNRPDTGRAVTPKGSWPMFSWSIAAMVLLALTLVLVYGNRETTGEPDDLAQLVDLLTEIEELEPEDVEELAETLEVLEYWELLENPTKIELLENS